MSDTREIAEQTAIDLHIADRDRATRDATNQLVASVLELRAAVGRTPYITTLLNSLADLDQVFDRFAEITDKAERWLDINGQSTASVSAVHDTDMLIKDLRRDLKGATAALSQQHRLLHRSVSRAWSTIAHREGVVGRETW